MWPAIGGLISGASSFLGGLFGSQRAKEQQYWNNIAAVNAANAAANNQQAAYQQSLATANQWRSDDAALQREFAQSGIQWRVNDARAAGIHPVFALSGGGAAYSPSGVSMPGAPAAGAPNINQAASNPLSGLSAMGQDVSRALMATANQQQRDQAFDQTARDLSLQNMTLRNELLTAQIAKLKNGQVGPPSPTLGDKGVVLGQDDDTDRTQLFLGGSRIKTEPGTSNADKFEERYGEMSDWIYGPYIQWKDFNYSQSVTPPSKDQSYYGAIERQLHHDMAKVRYRNSGNWKGHF